MKSYILLLGLFSLSCSQYQGGDSPETNGRCPNMSANLVAYDFTGRDLSGCDFSGVNLSKANFSDAILRQTIFDQANLSESTFANNDAFEASFKGSFFRSATISQGNWVRADFTGAELSNLVWSGSTIEASNFQETQGSNVRFEDVTIIRSHFGDSAFSYTKFVRGVIQESYFNHTSENKGLAQVSFEETRLHRVTFEGAVSSGLNFTNNSQFSFVDFKAANLSASNFSSVSGANIRFDQGAITSSQFTGVNLNSSPIEPIVQASLEEEQQFWSIPESFEGLSFNQTTLSNTQFASSIMHGASFQKTVGSIHFRSSDISSSIFSEAELPLSTFSEGANLTNVQFNQADLSQSHFIGSIFNGTSFLGSQLKDARFSDIVGSQAGDAATGVLFQESPMDGVNFHRVKFSGLVFENVIELKGHIYSSEMVNSQFNNLSDSVINVFSSDLSLSSFFNSSLNFHAIKKSNFSNMTSDGFSFNNTKPWEENQFQIMIDHGNFSGAVLKGGVADQFYQWIFGVQSCTASNKALTPYGRLRHPQGANAPWKFSESILSPAAIDNLNLMQIQATCGNYQCVKNGSNLNCSVIP
ncbi:pentapeptide repeat-containing protein [Pseudobacteriovorax antillogorgiicola]|nr:pentapeptide repeat-containing protein [Pseudobacteriovorax antillogorgiicola]